MSRDVKRAKIIASTAPGAVDEVLRTLAAGELVALPTETVYGLAACASNPDAIAKVFAAKERPAHDPLIVHTRPDLAYAIELGLVAVGADTELTRRLIGAYWPGPLTILLPRGGALEPAITAGQPFVALRAPNNAFFQEVLAKRGYPLVAPSANKFGHVSPTSAAHVAADLGRDISLIVDSAPSSIGIESTVIQPGHDSITLLRRGAISVEELAATTGAEIVEGTRVLERPLAPGQLARHYATATPLKLIMEPSALRPSDTAALIVVSGSAPAGVSERYAKTVELAPSGDLRRAAARLYSTMRSLDLLGLERIEVLGCEPSGIGAALMDRLERAATH